MSWTIRLLPDVEKDISKLGGNQKKNVAKAIKKVAQNPLPANEGGYGKPLGGDLAGYQKIKLKSDGIRVVYKLVQTDTQMLVIVVGARADNEVYEDAKQRIAKYNL